ncbi:hypothetical protein acsn021_31880 [Anaerocolumna cellulosilytica]|uniref:Uncharacterized protein n=1 Tax=Anaerocolumna cellulosilytica TaxID=433286 RepID=A0A6S6R2R0_9FIRM|nr:hypothetical protein [Anaerocolumna cellulosilytica]MBB5196519.1 hypothetical protein [Anaerocolumna cellulosilytica]BCJ95619.1 hypothetical protein acsn021_31880 [Anaerocolumna cellulosilytica]
MNAIELRRLRDKGPYDTSLDNNISMYDKLPYQQDVSLYTPGTLFLTSGNVIKYYRCKVKEEFTINSEKNDQ